jgi:hypothetical protein
VTFIVELPEGRIDLEFSNIIADRPSGVNSFRLLRFRLRKSGHLDDG